MKGFKSIEELSLKSCYNFLSSEENREHTLYPAIAERYQEMLQDLEKQDASDYAACKTMDNYNAYIKKFSDNSIAPYYKAKHINEAKNAIEDLFWNTHKKSVGGCKEYLSRYPKGKYANIANNRIGSSKKTKWLVLGIVLIVLVIAFFIGYKPVNSLSVSETSLSFGKWGGQESVRVSTNVPSNAVDVHCSGLGFSIDGDYGHEFEVSAEPNEGDSRTGNVMVTAYATLYGMRLWGENHNVKIVQESGQANYVKVHEALIDGFQDPYMCFSDNNDRIYLKSFCDRLYDVYIETDGVSEAKISSTANWLEVRAGEGSRYNDGVRYHVCLITDANAGGRRDDILNIRVGNIEKHIEVVQQRGNDATYLQIDNDDLFFSEQGSCHCKVKCDGFFDVRDVPDWIEYKCHYNGNGGSIYFYIKDNNHGYEGVTVYTSSGIEKYISISKY